MSPEITIIVPVRNGALTLKRCLDSIINQKFKNFEVLICDGSSSDASIEIIQEYCTKDCRIKLISRKDQGQADAINKGIKASKAKYLTWLNADDALCKSTVYQAVNKMNEEPNVNLVYGSVLDVDSRDQIVKLNRGQTLPSNELSNYYFIPQAGTVTRNEQKIYLNENLNWGLDWDYFIRVSKKGDILNINNIVARCIIEDTNSQRKSSNLTMKRTIELWHIRRKYGNISILFNTIFFITIFLGVILLPLKPIRSDYYSIILKLTTFAYRIIRNRPIIL